MSAACSTERSQHVELPCLQPVSGEGLAAGTVKVTRQAVDSTQHLKRRHIQVRALPVPGRDDVVYLVAACLRHLVGHWD